MDDSIIIKIKNHLSDRIEEIRDGTYIPYYERFKDLPEFRGIEQETFEIARREWYKENLPASYVKPLVFVKKRLKRSLTNGFCFLFIGVILLVLGLVYGGGSNWSGGSETILIWIGIIIMVFGIIILLYNRFRKS